jgi:hypothetical protein
MTYTPNNAKQIEKIPAGEIVNGIIISIADGTPRQFIKNQDKVAEFKNADTPAINCTIEFRYKNAPIMRHEQMFTYINGADGVLYTDKSNIGKYFKQYGKLPEVSDKVQLISNAHGFFKVII